MRKIKIITLILVGIFLIIFFNCDKVYADTTPITYQTHVENIGWQEEKKEGTIAGTEGKALRLESIKINNDNKEFNIKYQVHVQNIGWKEWKKNGELAGTTGQALRLEGIKIKLENTEKYSIEYRVHVENIGWQEWKKNGELAGTTGQALRLEAIQIRIVENDDISVYYQSHVENIGWQDYCQDGVISGTEGKSLRLEAIKIKLANGPDDAQISYSAYIPTIGWQTEKSDGEIAGTEGKALKMESIKINLVNLEDYSVQYRVHIENIGWTKWKRNGEEAGTPNSKLRIEAIEIKVVNKDEEQLDYYNGIDVSNYQGTIDWAKVKKDNIDFAIIRAGFRGYGETGSLNEDRQFEYNIKNAISNGIDVGVYFFSQATTVEEAVQEANYTLNIIKGYKITYPVIIDVEYATSEHIGRADEVSKEMRTQIVIAFCEKIRQAGYIPMFYSDKWFLTNNLDADKLKDYEYWLAHYTGAVRDNPLLKPSNYSGNYSIWQYSSSGTVSGISGNVDLDICYKKY